ncbi:hypothetical protein AXF42_Ash014053 [Apostasia shenzhenica]|uniref:Uncharacterized protein n=1 Tax=Apostasia shenzhenica TaxID=1088818 RepID=A0A2I0A9A0_9ASPA|nr:hypothetical protein AXF42_Ash014053 [Apostasia shenzhenica]
MPRGNEGKVSRRRRACFLDPRKRGYGAELHGSDESHFSLRLPPRCSAATWVVTVLRRACSIGAYLKRKPMEHLLLFFNYFITTDSFLGESSGDAATCHSDLKAFGGTGLLRCVNNSGALTDARDSYEHHQDSRNNSSKDLCLQRKGSMDEFLKHVSIDDVLCPLCRELLFQQTIVVMLHLSLIHIQYDQSCNKSTQKNLKRCFKFLVFSLEAQTLTSGGNLFMHEDPKNGEALWH